VDVAKAGDAVVKHSGDCQWPRPAPASPREQVGGE
jgi:hypothetical protein